MLSFQKLLMRYFSFFIQSLKIRDVSYIQPQSHFRQATFPVLSGHMWQVSTILDNTTKSVCICNVSQTKIEHSNTLFY